MVQKLLQPLTVAIFATVLTIYQFIKLQARPDVSGLGGLVLLAATLACIVLWIVSVKRISTLASSGTKIAPTIWTALILGLGLGAVAVISI